MKASCFVLGALVAAGAARAQSLTELSPAPATVPVPTALPAPAPAVVLIAPPANTLGMAGRPQAFANVQPAPPTVRPYMGNAADSTGNAVMNNNKASFDAWVTDPRLYAGINLMPHLAIETGIANLYDRGTFYAQNDRRENVAGAFGSSGFNSYLAGKLTVPVTDRLEAYGKAGRAYSQYDYRDLHHAAVTETDAGPYVGVGAHYKLNDKATISGGYERYGDSQKWGGASNNNGVSAKVKLGF